MPEIEKIKEDLPNFNLQELDNFDTIDDEELANIILDFPKENTDNDNSKVTSTVAVQKTSNTNTNPIDNNSLALAQLQNFNTQFNTINNNQMQLP